MSARLAIGLWLALQLATGCVTFAWNRDQRYAPVPPAVLGHFVPGRTGLDECLAALGAPLWVWENAEDGRASQVLAYGWFDERDRGLRVSVPVYRELSVSYDYAQIDERMRGLVLFFDQDWKLTAWREGLLHDLTQELRRPPPAFVADDERKEGA